jgi:hypothetical protein
MEKAANIKIFRNGSNEAVEPTALKGIGRASVERMQREWFRFKAENRPHVPPDNDDWDWVFKKGAAYDGIACGLEVEGQLQWLMLLDRNPIRGRREGTDGKSVLYIRFLEVAPWN